MEIDNKEFNALNKRVIRWADDKGILQKATPLAQISKTLEETLETLEAVTHQSAYNDSYINSKGKLVNTDNEIKDGFGDILVTVLIGCKMQGLDPLECLKHSLEVIEKRNGKMINGQFVKNE